MGGTEMGTYSQNQVIKFITEYKTAYEEISHIKLTVSETHSNFRFVESLKLCNIDDSFLNKIPESTHLKSKFVINGDIDDDIKSLSDLKDLNGKTYKTKNDEVLVTTTIKKDVFIEEYKLVNKYLFTTLEDFLYSLEQNKLSWNSLDFKMNIFLLESKTSFKSSFKSSFLNIELFNPEQRQIADEKIPKLDVDRFIRFNKIYEVYDDKQIKTYFDYPQTWLSNNKSNVSNLINNKLLNTFIKIICNNDLGKNRYLIRGHKTITLTLEYTEDNIQEKEAVQVGELFNFILDDEKHHDKLNILRNTLTIFLDSDSNVDNFVEKCDEILKSVKYNFNLYIQDRVKLFLEQKNKLLHEFINTTRKIEELTGHLIGQIRTVSLSLLGTIFLSLLNNINQGKSRAILNLVILSYVFYLVLNFLIVYKQDKQKEALLRNLKEYTEELGAIGDNKDNNLSYSSLKVKYLDSSLEYYENYRLSLMIGLFILSTLFIMLYFSMRFNIFPFVKNIIKFIIGY